MVDTSRANEAQVFQDMVDQCVLAEEMGFDCIWSVEHHCLTQYAHLSAPESFLAFIAGRTTKIHVGHGVVCLPFNMNHPIKVAERVATLDLLSRGRLHFGVGKGGTVQETGAFDTKLEDVTPQVDESMYMIPKMWMQEEFEHHGLIDIPPRPIHPKPFQDPHPLMYMACTREEALSIAGSRGLGALVLGFSGPDEIARKNAIYRKAWASRKPQDQVCFRPHQHLAALCPTIILDDRDKARRIGLRGQRFFAESITHWYGGGAEHRRPGRRRDRPRDRTRQRTVRRLSGPGEDSGHRAAYLELSYRERCLWHRRRRHPAGRTADRRWGRRNPVPGADGHGA